MSDQEIIICLDVTELHRRAAELFIRLAKQAVESCGRFAAALSGGSTPKGLYSLLATPGYMERVPWDRVHLFWGDERCVPPDHPDSNYRMVRESLLTKITIPENNVHRMAGENKPKLAAAQYEKTLRNFFQLSSDGLSRFDLIFLGIGEDGHTASLFPGSGALENDRNLVAATYVEKLKANRITLTLPVLNQGANILFLVAGGSKAAILERLLGPGATAEKLPAGRVKPQNGRLIWLVTQDAAADLRIQ